MTTSDIVYQPIQNEEQRQRDKIGLIPSQNNVSSRVAGVLGSCLSSRFPLFAEG
jgi:glycine/serine hydroxymethyltransferase